MQTLLKLYLEMFVQIASARLILTALSQVGKQLLLASSEAPERAVADSTFSPAQTDALSFVLRSSLFDRHFLPKNSNDPPPSTIHTDHSTPQLRLLRSRSVSSANLPIFRTPSQPANSTILTMSDGQSPAEGRRKSKRLAALSSDKPQHPVSQRTSEAGAQSVPTVQPIQTLAQSDEAKVSDQGPSQSASSTNLTTTDDQPPAKRRRSMRLIDLSSQNAQQPDSHRTPEAGAQPVPTVQPIQTLAQSDEAKVSDQGSIYGLLTSSAGRLNPFDFKGCSGAKKLRGNLDELTLLPAFWSCFPNRWMQDKQLVDYTTIRFLDWDRRWPVERAPALTKSQMNRLTRMKIYGISEPLKMTNLLSFLAKFSNLSSLEIDQLCLSTAAEYEFKELQTLLIHSIKLPGQITDKKLLQIEAPNLKKISLGESRSQFALICLLLSHR